MYLQEVLNLEWIENLHESLNTKIKPHKWEKNGNTMIGYININDETFTVELEPIQYQQFNAINIGFSKIIDGKQSQELTLNNKNASGIIGAIANAIHEKLNDYDYDAIVFMARDNVQQRIRIYNIVAKKFNQMFKYMIPNVNIGNNALMTILIGKSLPDEELENFKNHLSTLNK